MASPRTCPFCDPAPGALLAESAHARAISDAHPVTPGHTLVIPRRHAASLFALTDEEWDDLWRLVRRLHRELPALHDADGVNVGLNDGSAAGQTVAHAHVHLIPRHSGDVADPRGGVRWVVPDRAAYWDSDAETDTG